MRSSYNIRLFQAWNIFQRIVNLTNSLLYIWQGRIQNAIKHLRWNFLWSYLTTFNRRKFLQKAPFWMFDKVMNMFCSVNYKNKQPHKVKTNQDTSYINVFKTLLENHWNNSNNKINWLICKADCSNPFNIFFGYQSHVIFFSFNQHIFCVAFYSKLSF